MWTAILIFLLLSAIYISLILPRLINRADMRGLCEDYAHRGLHGEGVPENSTAAFRLAVEKGVGIELDIQLSKDKVVMVFHDDTLKRVCGIDARVSDYTCEELRNMKLLGSEYTIPTFSEVLDIVDGKVPLLVEFKPGDYELSKLGCDMLDDYNGPFCVESFDPFMVQRIKKYRPKFARGQLVCNMGKAKKPKNPILRFGLTMLISNLVGRPDFVAFDKNHRFNPSVLICRYLFRIPMFVWTVKGDDEYEKYKNQGLIPIFEEITI